MQEIKQNESLSKYTTYHIGGPAKYFVVVKNEEELQEALEWAKENNQKYFLLGGGTNLLFSDKGFDGLVIKLMFMDFKINGEEVLVGAGLPLMLAVKKSISAGLEGMENFAGIPGTVGGAVVGNAGAYGSAINEVIEKAELFIPSVIPAKAGIQTIDNKWFEYKYRYSKLKNWEGDNKPVVLRVWLKLKKGNQQELENRVKEITKHRADKEPQGFCAGCAFKNIKRVDIGEKEFNKLLENNEFEKEERERFMRYGAIPAAWFIDHAELKETKINGAYVPKEHANYIMNDGSATAESVLELLSLIKQRVRDKFGVQLHEEIEIIL